MSVSGASGEDEVAAFMAEPLDDAEVVEVRKVLSSRGGSSSVSSVPSSAVRPRGRDKLRAMKNMLNITSSRVRLAPPVDFDGWDVSACVCYSAVRARGGLVVWITRLS